MAKGKHGPALYELLGRSRGDKAEAPNPAGLAAERARNLQLGSLWGSKTATAGSTAGSRETTGDSASRPASALGAGSEPRTVSGFEIAGGRIVARLSHRALAGLVFVLIGVVFLGGVLGYKIGLKTGNVDGFKLGQNSIQATADDAIEAARKAPAETVDIFQGTGGVSPLLSSRSPDKSKVEEAGKPEGTLGWIKGFTYVDVQDFRATEQQVMESIQTFLSERGIETTAIKNEDGDYRFSLITNRGFNRKDTVQEQRFQHFWSQIQEFGKEYKKSGGRHELKGYPWSFKGD